MIENNKALPGRAMLHVVPGAQPARHWLSGYADPDITLETVPGCPR